MITATPMVGDHLNPARVPPQVGEPLRRVSVPAQLEGLVVVIVSSASYLALAAFLVLAHNVIEGDALSRVGNASYVLFSRDPHLAAIGFVWNPLPSLAALPLLPFKQFWPALVTLGFAANIVTVGFMAGAIYQLNRTLYEIRLARPARLALTVLFAIHPLIAYHGANGLSEAPMVFFLLIVARRLIQWLDTSSVSSLIYMGVALALAYLTRYESAAAAAGAILIVVVISLIRTSGTKLQRLGVVANDVVIAGAPFLLAFLLWTTTSWIITGQPFPQFSSDYGNAAQIQALRQYYGSAASALGTAAPALPRTLALEPFLPIFILVGVLAGAWRRDVRPFAVLAILCSVLLFEFWAYQTGKTGSLNRYFIYAIPLAVLMAGLLLSPAQAFRAGRPVRIPAIDRGVDSTPDLLPKLRSLVVILGSLLALGAAIPTSAEIMLAPKFSDEATALRVIFQPAEKTKEFATAHQISAYLDSYRLHRGAVLVDTFQGFPIVLDSRRPDSYIVTSDRDFRFALSDPSGAGVEYLIVPSDQGVGSLDAINRAYPGIYETGAKLGQLIREFNVDGDPSVWRLYRVEASG